MAVSSLGDNRIIQKYFLDEKVNLQSTENTGCGHTES